MEVWSEVDLLVFVSSGERPATPQATMPRVQSMIVLGSLAASDGDAGPTLTARIQKGQRCWSANFRHFVQGATPLRRRVQLLDAILRPVLMWGLESVPLSKALRGQLDSFQRKCLSRMLRIASGPEESTTDFCRRRERCISGVIRRSCKCKWSQQQRYSFSTCPGHVARL